MDKDYLKRKLEEVSEHIKNDCSSEGEWESFYSRKGFIISDDESGDVRDFVENALKIDELKALGKVNELTIDESWDSYFRRTEKHKDNNYLDVWNKLVTAAYKANHGLLVINISNIKVFEHCWHLKQLAKQECKLPLKPKYSYDFDAYTKEDIVKFREDTIADYGDVLYAEQLMELIDGFMFDGYVLIVVKDMSWEYARKRALQYNSGEWDAMMQFYKLI